MVDLFALSCFYPRHPRGWRQGDPGGAHDNHCVSIHATLAGGDIGPNPYYWTKLQFLSTPPSRVATSRCGVISKQRQFLSTPPSRVATMRDKGTQPWYRMFLSTPPSRVATASASLFRVYPCSFYPRHPRGWRPRLQPSFSSIWIVSIHATLAGGDCDAFELTSTSPRVSIHATLAGGDFDNLVLTDKALWFLSTPPSRVATAKVYKNVQCLLRKREKIICKIKNNLKHPPHIPIATSKKCTACPKTSDDIGAKLLGKVCLLPPRTGAATQAAHHPEQIRGGGQGAPRGFCSGCQAGKSAGCRFRGQSARPARL